MKKSDLKTGMIVEVRSGEEYVVFIDVCITQYVLENYIDQDKNNSLLIDSANNNWLDLGSYNENMCSDSGKSFDIMKIYIPYHPYGFMNVSYNKEKRHLIWERNTESTEESTKEVTMKELEKYFGYKIKIVG